MSDEKPPPPWACEACGLVNWPRWENGEARTQCWKCGWDRVVAADLLAGQVVEAFGLGDFVAPPEMLAAFEAEGRARALARAEREAFVAHLDWLRGLPFEQFLKTDPFEV